MNFILLMNQYFREEKVESLIFGIVSILLIVLSCYLFFGVKSSFSKGIATVLLVSGLTGCIVGGTVFFRTDQQVRELTSLFKNNPNGFLQKELPRMEKVMKSFKMYKFIYLVSFLCALSFIYLLKVEYWQGLALGLLVFGTLGMIIDLVAERRGELYLNALLELR